MAYVVLGILALAIGAFLMVRGGQPVTSAPQPSAGGRPTPRDLLQRILAVIPGSAIGALMIASGLFLLASTSFVYIEANRVGHLKRIYALQELPPGRIIALSGQKGPQARILGPGFYVEPLINVLFEIDQFEVVKVPEGHYGEIVAADGQPMPEGVFVAPRIPDDRVKEMLDART